MKTLINKSNPQIRITAPEIEEYEHFYSIPNWYGYNKSDWTLVEEEHPEEICPKCVYCGKDDGYCYNPHGGMRRRINENGVYECTGFCEKEQKQPDVDLENEIKKHTDLFVEELEYPLSLTARKFYNLGRKGGLYKWKEKNALNLSKKG